jgi:hypothetical protein
MAAVEPQVIEPQEFISILDYEFSGGDVTVRNKRLVIESLRKRAVIYLAAQDAGVNKLTVYRWREADPQFAAAMAEALEDASEIMESSIYERALKGDSLLSMFWLKRHNPAYRDKVSIDVQVVQSEIVERMNQLGLQGFPLTTEFIETPVSAPSCMQFQPQPNNSQKEHEHE